MKRIGIVVAALVLACATHAADEQTKAGKIGMKALNAPEGVVAVLYVGDAPVDLTATGETAAKLEELAKRGANVSVTGTAQEKSFAVTKVAEAADEKGEEPKKKKKEGKKPGKKKKKEEAAMEEKPGMEEKPAMEGETK